MTELIHQAAVGGETSQNSSSPKEPLWGIREALAHWAEQEASGDKHAKRIDQQEANIDEIRQVERVHVDAVVGGYTQVETEVAQTASKKATRCYRCETQ